MFSARCSILLAGTKNFVTRPFSAKNERLRGFDENNHTSSGSGYDRADYTAIRVAGAEEARRFLENCGIRFRGNYIHCSNQIKPPGRTGRL
jgi:hypothetical protein